MGIDDWKDCELRVFRRVSRGVIEQVVDAENVRLNHMLGHSVSTSGVGRRFSFETFRRRVALLGPPPGDEHVERSQYLRRLLTLMMRCDEELDASDPAYDKLTTIGRQDFYLLLSALDWIPVKRDVLMTVARLADLTHRNAIIEAMAIHPELADIVFEHGWERDAHDVLVELLRYQRHLPLSVYRSVLLLDDPTIDDLLIESYAYAPTVAKYQLLTQTARLRERLDAVAIRQWNETGRRFLSEQAAAGDELALAIRAGDADAFRTAMNYARFHQLHEEGRRDVEPMLSALRDVMLLPREAAKAFDELAEADPDRFEFDRNRRLFVRTNR